MMTENRVTCLLVGLVVMAAYQTQQWLSGDRLVDCPPAPAAAARPVCTALDLLCLRAAPARCRLGELRAAAAASEGADPLATATTAVLLALSILKAVLDVWRERRAHAAQLAAAPAPPASLSILQLTEPFLATKRRLAAAAAQRDACPDVH